MRNPEEREVALECLRLAVAAQSGEPVEVAERFFAFVVGDDARAKLDAVRAALR